MRDDAAFGGLTPEELAPWTVKRNYLSVFQVPTGHWSVWTNWEEGYFFASKRLVGHIVGKESVLKYPAMPGIEGTAAVYAFRHYLELALKHILFHSRWLKDGSSNAHWTEIKSVAKTHALQPLWNTIKTERVGKIADDFWNRHDIHFVDACINEFHAVDPSGEAFRYPGPVIGVGQGATSSTLGIWFEGLFEQMQHVYDVLWSLDAYCLNTHGLNEEWEDIQNSY